MRLHKSVSKKKRKEKIPYIGSLRNSIAVDLHPTGGPFTRSSGGGRMNVQHTSKENAHFAFWEKGKKGIRRRSEERERGTSG
jgi:hypothetical protein